MAATLPPRGITGTVPSNPFVAAKRLNTDRTPPFEYQWNYTRWEVVEDPDKAGAYIFLPVLGKLKKEPGIGAVDKNGGMTFAVAARAERGWNSIPLHYALSDDTPDGQPGYVRTWPGRGGLIHGSAWESPRQVGNRTIWSHDIEGYRRWLKRLMVDGHIHAPDPAVTETLLEVAKQRADRGRGRAMSNPHAKVLLEQAEERLKAIQAATIPGQEAPKSPRRSRAPKKMEQSDG